MEDDSKLNPEYDDETNSIFVQQENSAADNQKENPDNSDFDLKNFAQTDSAGSFEDAIDFNQEINLDDIEKLQAQIQQNMSPELAELAKEEEEEDDKDSVLKKYIVYISKDFVQYLDKLSTNELSAYINDAIQKKLDSENEGLKNQKRQKILSHILVAIITFFITAPILMIGAYKSIITTLNSYKYSQESFEKLYEQRFKKDKVYMKSLKYNKMHSKENEKK